MSIIKKCCEYSLSPEIKCLGDYFIENRLTIDINVMDLLTIWLAIERLKKTKSKGDFNFNFAVYDNFKLIGNSKIPSPQNACFNPYLDSLLSEYLFENMI